MAHSRVAFEVFARPMQIPPSGRPAPDYRSASARISYGCGWRGQNLCCITVTIDSFAKNLSQALY